MQLVWALRFLLLYLTQSVVCRYIRYETNLWPASNIGGKNDMFFHSPNAWYRQHNGYPWWRVVFPSSWTLPNVYFTDEPQQLSDSVNSPFLTKLRYYYSGSEYNLPNFVARPIVFEPILHDTSCLDETDQLSTTENVMVPVSEDDSHNNYIYESNTDLASAEEFDKVDVINEMQHIPLKESLNENSPYNPGETKSSHFSPVTTEPSLEFSAPTGGSKFQKSKSNNSPDNSHVSLDLEIVNFNNSLVDNAFSEDSNSEVQTKESAMESSEFSTVFPLNTSEYSSDTTATNYPTEIQLFVLAGLTENERNESHIVPELNSPNAEDGSTTSKYPGHIFHLNVTTGKLNPKELEGIANETTEIPATSSISATSAINLLNEIVESNVVAAIVHSTVQQGSSTLTSPSPTEKTNTLEGSELITPQMFNNKIEEPNDKVSNYENANLFSEKSATSFSPVKNTTAENLVTHAYLNMESTESTFTTTHASILPTELSTLIPLHDSEAGSNVFIEGGVVQLSTFDSTTNMHAQDYSSESTLPTLGSFSEPSTTEIPDDFSTFSVGEINLSEPNYFSPMESTTTSESESLNTSDYAEDATVSQNPDLVLNLSLNVTSLSEESNTKETLILNTNTPHYLLMANGSIETSTDKLAMDNSAFTTEAVEQNNKVHETENISSVLTSEILLTSPSYSEDESISVHEAPTTQHSFNISEVSGSNDQLTASDSPFYSSITNFPLQMEITNSENWVNPTTEINSNFNPTQELSNKVNESGNLNVITYPLITNSDNTNIHFPTNNKNEICCVILTASSVIKTQDSLTENHESANDSIIFPYNHFLPEKDYSTNSHHNISFLDSYGNVEPIHSLDNFENVSSINVHSFIEDAYNEASSNIPEAYQNDMRENGENINDGVNSLVTQHPSINNVENGEQNSKNEFAEIGQDEYPSESQDNYTISSKIDVIESTSENTFTSTIDSEITSLPGDIIAVSNQHDNSFNKNEDNPSDRSSLFTTPSYGDSENGNILFPQFSENVSNEDKNYPVVTSVSLSYDKVSEDNGSQLSMMKPNKKYEFSQNENKHEVINSYSESYTPAYSVIGTDNSLSLLHGDEMHTTENIIHEKSESNIYKEEEPSSQNHNQGISEAKEEVDSAQIIDDYSFHNENAEDPSEATFTDVPPDYIYETEPSSHSFGGSLTEFGNHFSDSFYGLKFPEITEPSHSLKKYLPPAQGNIEEIASTVEDSVNQSPYFEESSETSNAQEKENVNPSDSQKPLTDIYYFEESPEILDEETYSASQDDDDYEDSTLPQENKVLHTYNNLGSNSFPNSVKYIPQNIVGGFHRSDIPIEDEFSHDDQSSTGLFQRRKRRQATLSQAHTQKPETEFKLPSGDFSAIPHGFTKGINEKVPFPREKRTFGKIHLLNIFHKKPELAEYLGFYKGKLIKNGILRPLLQKKLHFLHKKLFLTRFLAGLLHIHDSGHYKRSIQMKPTPAPHPCDPCDPHTKSIHSSESVEDDYTYSDDEYHYFDEKPLESAVKSYEVKATPVYDDSDASITDFISMLPSFERPYSD